MVRRSFVLVPFANDLSLILNRGASSSGSRCCVDLQVCYYITVVLFCYTNLFNFNSVNVPLYYCATAVQVYLCTTHYSTGKGLRSTWGLDCSEFRPPAVNGRA